MSILVIKKGAIASVLGFPIGGSTIGTHYSEGHRVRLTVCIGQHQTVDPTEAQFVKIAETITQIVDANKPVYVLKMSRAEAEAKYKNAMYNRHAVRSIGCCACFVYL